VPVTTTGTSVTRTAGGVFPRPRPRPAPALFAGALALVLGLAVGRFVTYDRGAADTVHPAVRATAPASDADIATTVAQLEATTRRSPADANAWSSLGSAYIRRATQGDPSFYDLAQRAFGRADRLQPALPATLLGRGALALARHQFSGALRIADRALQRDAHDPDALVTKTDADVELGHYEAAEADLQALLARKPSLAAFARVSYLRELHGDVDGAVLAMRQARVAGANSMLDTADVTTFLGDLELNRGRPRAALSEYDRAVTAVPKHTLATLGRARALAALGRTDEAVRVLTTLVDRVPLPAAAELLGDLHALQGDRAAAADAYGLVRATTRLQHASGVVVDLELARFETDHAPDRASARHALALARAAYHDRPDNLYAADVLAWAELRAGDAAAARPLVDRALRLGTRDAALHYHAAAVLHATGDDVRARHELAAAFATNPYFTYSQRADAVALARTLGIAAPAAWSP
jgi:tetratricopeptide (TPR) repeat protein